MSSDKRDSGTRTPLQEAVKQIGRTASSGHFVSAKSYDSKSYGDLTVVTKTPPAKKK